MATQTTTTLQLQTLEATPTPWTLTSPESSSDGPASPVEAPLAATAPTPAPPPTLLLPPFRAVLVTAQLCSLLFLNSLCNGLVVVALPAMQSGLGLAEGLLVWPTSSYYLAAGSCLLLAGSVADVAGAKRLHLAGSLLAALFALGCGLAPSGGGLIAFRALQGVTSAMVTPSSISIVSNSLEEGRPRNMGFACLGFSQPLGFCVGLVLGGVFTDTVGWRPAFYLAAAATLALFLLAIWALPQDPRPDADRSVWARLASQTDWVGLLLASTGLAVLSYVLASLSSDINNIRLASTIVLLVISGCSIPSFVAWMHYQTKNNRPALIPNSLWRSHVFTSSCIMILLTNAIASCMELYSSLFFQQVQSTSALGASLRVLPSLLAGVLTNILTGVFVNRMPVFWAVLLSAALSAAAPLLMALIRPEQLYWENAFFAQILTPISCDILFTVGLLIISDVYPKHMQALGGAVFNTCAQLGAAIGLSVTQVVASSVTGNDPAATSSPDALMKGYRAAFWVMFGCMVFVCAVSTLGLRKVGLIGVKRD